ncbi:hypothetical protein CLU79DRAFT_727872 [Phycomyces nitens]|nr:hypothetical protein CLU79DRAFT_727872 [Phycomyces nitens]
MSAAVGLAWMAFGMVSVGLYLFSAGFINYYHDKHHSRTAVTLVSVWAVGLALCLLALLPVDVFLVSITVDHQTGLKQEWADENTVYWITMGTFIVYYGCHALIGLLLFFVLPFAYFYYKKYDEDQDRRQRALTGLRYTVGFGILACVLFMIGLFGRPTQLPVQLELEWFLNLVNESYGEKAISFVMACPQLLGMIVFVGYTAPGLSILPFKFLKDRGRVDTEYEDISAQLAENLERQREIEGQTGGSRSRHSDERTLENLIDEAKIFERQLKDLEDDRNKWRYKLWLMVRPFELGFGLALLATSFLIVLCIILSCFDKMVFSICGNECGYIASSPDFFQPINFILISVERAFPLDYIMVVGLIVYLLMVTMVGIDSLGLKFLWVTLYRVERKATGAQALVISSTLLTLGLLAANYSIVSFIAPAYAHFGSQVYCNSEGDVRDCSLDADLIVPCDIYGPTDICTPTVTSTSIDRISFNSPRVSVLYYYGHWMFVVTYVAGFVMSLVRKPPKDIGEEEGLLDRTGKTYQSIHDQ